MICFVVPLRPGVPGEGADGHLPSKIVSPRPLPARPDPGGDVFFSSFTWASVVVIGSYQDRADLDQNDIRVEQTSFGRFGESFGRRLKFNKRS